MELLEEGGGRRAQVVRWQPHGGVVVDPRAVREVAVGGVAGKQRMATAPGHRRVDLGEPTFVGWNALERTPTYTVERPINHTTWLLRSPRIGTIGRLIRTNSLASVDGAYSRL